MNHILASLGSDSKVCRLSKNLPRNIILWALTQTKSGEWLREDGGVSLKLRKRGQDGGVHEIGPAVWLRNKVEAEEGDREKAEKYRKKFVSYEMQEKR